MRQSRLERRVQGVDCHCEGRQRVQVAQIVLDECEQGVIWYCLSRVQGEHGVQAAEEHPAEVEAM
jgi:hypothetical protein